MKKLKILVGMEKSQNYPSQSCPQATQTDEAGIGAPENQNIPRQPKCSPPNLTQAKPSRWRKGGGNRERDRVLFYRPLR